jgi:hypothetical protein
VTPVTIRERVIRSVLPVAKPSDVYPSMIGSWAVANPSIWNQ